jgi:SAM-dependent methyltransferase
MTTSVDFWNSIYSADTSRIADLSDPVLVAAMDHFGNIEGKTILEIGCGDARFSLFFAKCGARVVSIDNSEVAVENLRSFCQEHGIRNVEAVCCSAFDIHELGEFDLIFGSMILHHLEPFPDFSRELRQALKSDGRAFFSENNAFSDLLVWARNNLVGKYGIPKYGDDDEFPLLPSEVNSLKKYFTVKQEHPSMVFMALASLYLLKGKLSGLAYGIDRFLYKIPSFRKFSYRQYLLIS